MVVGLCALMLGSYGREEGREGGMDGELTVLKTVHP